MRLIKVRIALSISPYRQSNMPASEAHADHEKIPQNQTLRHRPARLQADRGSGGVSMSASAMAVEPTFASSFHGASRVVRKIPSAGMTALARYFALSGRIHGGKTTGPAFGVLERHTVDALRIRWARPQGMRVPHKPKPTNAQKSCLGKLHNSFQRSYGERVVGSCIRNQLVLRNLSYGMPMRRMRQ